MNYKTDIPNSLKIAQRNILEDHQPSPINQQSAITSNFVVGLAPTSVTPMNLEPLNKFKSPAYSMLKKHEKRAKSIALNNLDFANKHYRVKGGSPGGVFLFDSSRRSRIDDDSDIHIVDFIKKNLNIGKEQKNMDFERSKDLINKIYQNIKKRKDYGLDLNNLLNIQQCLNPKLKHQFIANQNYYQIFADANILNSNFLQVINQVSCYRVELSLILQKFVESYNSIILQQFEEFYRFENAKEKELANKFIKQQKATEDLFQKRQEYEKRLESVQVLITSKDIQIQSLMEEQEQMVDELKQLRELIDEDNSRKPVKVYDKHSLFKSPLMINRLEDS